MPLELISIPDLPMAAIIEASILAVAKDDTRDVQGPHEIAIVRENLNLERPREVWNLATSLPHISF